MTRRTRILRIALLTGGSLLMIGLSVWMMLFLWPYRNDPEGLKAWMDSLGVWGPLIFMLLNLFQVFLAVIPGGVFELAAGYAFGVLPGTLFCLSAMTAGGMLNFFLVRKFGMAFAELFTTREKIESVRFLKTSKKKEGFLLLFFLLPGTPKDLMCYAVGFTDIKARVWLFINAVGRLPGVLMTVFSGKALGKQNYPMFVGITAAIAVMAAAGIFLYDRVNRNPGSKKEKS